MLFAVSYAVCAVVIFMLVVAWLTGSVLVLIKEVTLRLAHSVLGWMTIFRQTTTSVCNQPPRPTQPGHPSVDRHNEY